MLGWSDSGCDDV